MTARIAEAISYGLTDADAAALVGIDDDTLTQWRKIPEFSGAIKSAVATRKLDRLKRIDAGEPGWQGAAWGVERQDPKRFARPEVQLNQQISVKNQDSAFLWINHQIPKEKDAKAPIELEDMEFFCDGEEPLVDIQNMDIVSDAEPDSVQAICAPADIADRKASSRAISDLNPRSGVGMDILAVHASRQQPQFDPNSGR